MARLQGILEGLLTGGGDDAELLHQAEAIHRKTQLNLLVALAAGVR